MLLNYKSKADIRIFQSYILQPLEALSGNQNHLHGLSIVGCRSTGTSLECLPGGSLDSFSFLMPREGASLKCLSQAIYSESHQDHQQMPVSSVHSVGSETTDFTSENPFVFITVIMLISKVSSVDQH